MNEAFEPHGRQTSRRPTRRRNGFSGIALGCLALLCCSPAGAWTQTPFNTLTASVMQGVLEQGPNRSCSPLGGPEEVFPGSFVFRNDDPGEDHLYQAYTFYNNGPERCVEVQLLWTHQDCGGIEIGLGLYLDTFDPADPRQNLLSHAWDYNYDFFDVGLGGHPNDYRYSPGYYRAAGIEYHLDNLMFASAIVPPLSRLVVVLDSHAQPGDVAQCPVDPATSSLALRTTNLDTRALAIEVHDTSNYEFDPPGGASLTFYVSLSAQFSEPFTIDYATADGSADAGVDYQATSGQLTFQPGETTKLVQVPIVSDTDDETPPGSKTMTLTLSNASSPFVALAQATATGTIFDDDDTEGLCRITNFVGAGDLPLGKVGLPYGPVDLRGYSASFDPTAEYDWSVTGGALPPGVTLGEAPVEDPPGSGNFELHGMLAGTPTAAGTYSFTVHLACPITDPDGDPPPELYDAEMTIVIEPEDPQAILTLADVAVVEGNAGLTPVVMTIELSQALPDDLPLEVVLFDGSAAVADSDYEPLLVEPQPTQVNAGNVAEPFGLNVHGDLEVEGDEDYFVQLRTPIEHTVLATAKVTIVNDDAPQTLVEVPALGDFGLGLLALGLAGAGLRGVRRRRARGLARTGRE